MKYDFLIVGAGFAGATCARLLTDAGYKCLIIEERPFVGGNCVTSNMGGINIHIIGPHVFHTNNIDIWNFINKYDEFIDYKHEVYTYSNGKFYSNSMNLITLQQIYGFNENVWPNQYKTLLYKNLVHNNRPKNLEEYCLSTYGKDIYETILKGYYEKKYNKNCNELSSDIIEEKNNCSFLYNTGFYSDKYQGIPKHGYTLLIEKIIGDDIPIMLNTDYISNIKKFNELSNNIIYTGQLDKLMNYCIGPLDWGGIDINFSEESGHSDNLFGNSVINFNDKDIQYYRLTEHKWFDINSNLDNKKTYITYESYKEWKIGDIPYYCIHNNISLGKYNQYINFFNKNYNNIYLCGKNAEYKNYSMAETIQSAMMLCDKLINQNN